MTRRAREAWSPEPQHRHIVSMTIDWTDGPPGVSVGTCGCGWSHREPRIADDDSGRDPVVAGRLAAAARMDAAIEAHWRAENVDMPGGR